MRSIVERAESGEAYDQMLAAGNETGNRLVQDAIDALVDQTRTIERIIIALELGNVTLESSDSLTDPDSVFQ